MAILVSSSTPVPKVGSLIIARRTCNRLLLFPSCVSISPKFCPSRRIVKAGNRDEWGSSSFVVTHARNAEDDPLSVTDADFRGVSTLPERFKSLTKEIPEKPAKWPWIVAVSFILIYAWRAVLHELGNWKQAVVAITIFSGHVLKLIITRAKYFFGDSAAVLIEHMKRSLYLACLGIVTYCPVPDLTRIILWSSAVLAVAEATNANSISSQWHVLSLAGLVGCLLVVDVIPVYLFWISMASIFFYSRFFRKADVVSAALPVVAVVVAISEWVTRLSVMAFYVALAVNTKSESPKETENDVSVGSKCLPLPLYLIGLAVGIHSAARWICHYHLKWTNV